MTDTTPIADYERVKIKQNRGPTYVFDGKLLAETSWKSRHGDEMKLELWQTAGGALIPVTESDVETRAIVIEPGEDFAMKCAVMDFWAWENRARSMVRKALGWGFSMEIE